MRERWKSDLQKFHHEVNRLVEQSLNRIGNYWTADGTVRPSMDVYDFPEELVLFIELPGIRKEDVSISLVGRSLVVTAQKNRPDVDENLLQSGERLFGPCHRTYDLGCEVDIDGIDAVLSDGVLRVTIPKSSDAAQRMIEIKVG